MVCYGCAGQRACDTERCGRATGRRWLRRLGCAGDAAIAPFGFTGALQRGSDGWLRARWSASVVRLPFQIGGQFFRSADRTMWGVGLSLSVGTDTLPIGAAYMHNQYPPADVIWPYHGKNAQGERVPPTQRQALAFINHIQMLLAPFRGIAVPNDASVIALVNYRAWHAFYNSTHGSIHHQ